MASMEQEFHANDSNIFDFSIYPNPANNALQVQFSKQEATHLEILDLTGKVIYSIQINQSTVQINLEGFAEGCYILRARIDTGEQISKRMMIVR